MKKIMEKMNLSLWGMGTSTVKNGIVSLYIQGETAEFDLVTETVTGTAELSTRVWELLQDLADLYHQELGF